MHHSIHTARWIDMIANFGFEIHMYALDAGEPNQKLRKLTLHRPVLAVTQGDTQTVLPAPPPSQSGHALRLARFARLALTHPFQALRSVKRHLAAPRPAAAQPASAVITEAIVTRLVPVAMPPGARADERIRMGREGESDETIDRLHGPDTLAAVIAEVQPDLIHSMEFQHAGYLVMATRDLMMARNPAAAFPRWLATNWGSDIYHFGHEAGHSAQIRRMCETIDLYSCECQRDQHLGLAYGYKGPELPVLPNSGGMDMAHVLGLRTEALPSQRRIIMVKGYDHFAGRAMVSLAVLERFAAELKGYKIILFSVGARPRVRALELAAAGVLDIEVVDWATHDDILRFFGQARLYLGVSVSDAISTSVLESMAMGAFPVQTNTSCCDEWFIDGTTGFAVPVDDVEVIAARFHQALTDDALVDAAATQNLAIIRSRIALDVIVPRVKGFYTQALAGTELALPP
jgi:Glycosyl transferases group 1